MLPLYSVTTELQEVLLNLPPFRILTQKGRMFPFSSLSFLFRCCQNLRIFSLILWVFPFFLWMLWPCLMATWLSYDWEPHVVFLLHFPLLGSYQELEIATLLSSNKIVLNFFLNLFLNCLINDWEPQERLHFPWKHVVSLGVGKTLQNLQWQQLNSFVWIPCKILHESDRFLMQIYQQTRTIQFDWYRVSI